MEVKDGADWSRPADPSLFFELNGTAELSGVLIGAGGLFNEVAEACQRVVIAQIRNPVR